METTTDSLEPTHVSQATGPETLGAGSRHARFQDSRARLLRAIAAFASFSAGEGHAYSRILTSSSVSL